MDINWDEAPEGATHYCIGSTHDTVWRDLSGVDAKYWYQGEWHDHHGVSSEFCLKYGVFEERPTQQAWDGKGLPPVGTVCECQNDELKWLEGTIVHVGIHGSTKLAVMQTKEEILYGEVGEFRPIKTKEQIAAEEREKAIEEMYSLTFASTSQEVLDAQRQVCEALYDAGYRKQENNDAKA